MKKKILAINGSYRKKGIISQIMKNTIDSAIEAGAEVEEIFLLDLKINFCTNCRVCTQTDGKTPGKCVIKDDMPEIIKKIEEADGFIIGAPVNFYNINALTRKFMERLVVYAYWPWKKPGPSYRVTRSKKAILITSSAMPGIMGRFLTGAMNALKEIAKTIGAKSIGTIFVGLISDAPDKKISESTIKKARKLGRKIAN